MHALSGIAKTLSLGSLLLTLACATAPGKPVEVVEDSLNASVGRSAGDRLKDERVEKFDRKSFDLTPTWIARSNTVFSEEGGVTNREGHSMQALIAVNNPTKGQLTLKANAKVGNADWVALGFLSPSAPETYGEPNWFYPDNPLFAILTRKGRVNVIRNGAQDGAKNIIASWPVKGFSETSVYTFEFQYDLDTKRAIVKINGDPVGPGVVVEGLNDPSIGFVGFRAQGDDIIPGDTRVQNFSYTIVP
jgi:hypothetical protein